jgi:hypothetical protein
LSREGGSDSSIIVYLEIGRRWAFPDCMSFIIFGCSRIIVFQSNPVDSSRYAKSIWDNVIMISFVPGKPKVVTGNNSKNLEPMSLCRRNAKHTMWMENDKEPICHVSNI